MANKRADPPKKIMLLSCGLLNLPFGKVDQHHDKINAGIPVFCAVMFAGFKHVIELNLLVDAL